MNRLRQKLCVLLLGVGAFFVLGSCSDDAGEPIVFSPMAESIVKNGVEFSSNGGELELFYTTESIEKPDITVEPETEEWLSAAGSLEAGNGNLKIYCAPNSTENMREGLVSVRIGKAGFVVKVNQRPFGTLAVSSYRSVLGSEEQHEKIQLTSNGKLSFQIETDSEDSPFWVQYEAKEEGMITEVTLDVEANKGRGRVAFLNIFVDGIKKRTISLRQQPGPFSEDVDLGLVRAGSLLVRLGNDKENLRKIRRLRISGDLNALDLHVLKNLLFLSGPIAEAYPLALDLFYVELYGDKNPYYPDLDVGDVDGVVTAMDGALPDGAFANVGNLVSLTLPYRTKAIGMYCFRWCMGLTELEIPEEVRKIGAYAFDGCSNLKALSFSYPLSSKLKSLGSDAFATNGRLSLLVLPANLQEISPKAFRRCHVDSLYLSWETPPMVDLVPDAKNVFVLQGTKTLYEETPCWNKYTNISELDGDWEGISR